MFCADYALSFACFWFSNASLRELGVTDRALCSQPLPLMLGAFSGAVAAVALYPFDFVRASAVAAARPPMAVSIVPFSTLFFGLYVRPDGAAEPLRDRCARAMGASGCALAAELPLDRAKISLAGGIRNAALLSFLRWPLSAALLVAFETASAGASGGVL
mmetsp:Transcript_20149/g.60075  ORF Transcript_20149/g.60075 Transcript_20149/m.60075 type:complete len:160 (-) Transcript_20149:30-509(-)